ncbi:hypothetical protein HQ604_04220 [Rhodococcus corynebacterioides]|uniref:ParD-like antitoxin of type II toxin-antitoxin system n=1 Tax=Rhodococcoides corynebacterioides TaxID=53972 RepID=A0ABS7P275_9NOCA|nr:hypothetical protein [Rhodococcus corynebacterioides]MBY6407109.1 hypothetical protein [Rhodococcus corynebacterioides]
MNSTPSSHVRSELFASAQSVGRVTGRGATEQLAHWARIGREVEASRHLPSREIAEVLSGRQSYDTLDPPAQAVVRAEWVERVDALSSSLDLRSDFESEGRPYVECNNPDDVIARGASSSSRRTGLHGPPQL